MRRWSEKLKIEEEDRTSGLDNDVKTEQYKLYLFELKFVSAFESLTNLIAGLVAIRDTYFLYRLTTTTDFLCVSFHCFNQRLIFGK